MTVFPPTSHPTDRAPGSRAFMLGVLALTFGLSACLAQDNGAYDSDGVLVAASTGEDEEPDYCTMECDGGADAGDGGADAGDAGDAGCSDEEEFSETPVCGDAGTDGGADAGGDAGADAGSDGGADAGRDGGVVVVDAGTDGGADAGSDGGADAGRDSGVVVADAGADAGRDGGGGVDGGASLTEATDEEGREVLASFAPQAAPAPTPVLNPTPSTPADRTDDAEKQRMKERCGQCEVRPRGPIDPNKVPYISVHGINDGPNSMDPAIANMPANAQVYDFSYPDDRHPMETADCLRNAIAQVLKQHNGKTVNVAGHSLGATIAAAADHSLADYNWMPSEVPTTCGTKKVNGRHRNGFVPEPAPGPNDLDLRLTLIDPIFQGFGDYPLFIADCMPGRGDLIAGSAYLRTMNTRPTVSKKRRVFYADDKNLPKGDTAQGLNEFSDNELELICKMMRGERVRTRNFELMNAWNAAKNLPVGNTGKTLMDTLSCGGDCSAQKLKDLAGQTTPLLPGTHSGILPNVPF